MSRVLLALGGAHNVWDDFAQASALCDRAGVRFDVGAVNDAGRDYTGDLALWCSLHPEKIQKWQDERTRRRRNTDYTVVCHKRRPQVRIDMAIGEIWAGSSGLFLCQIAAITFGYTRIVCCGIPMDEEGHYFDSDPWRHATKYRRGWNEAKDQPEMAGKIRSMSGWTRHLLGEPDREWLSGGA